MISKEEIKQKAYELGFLAIGFSKATRLEKEERDLENWLNKNHQGEMHYMANHFDLRVDPTKLMPGAKTVISLVYNYFTEESQPNDAPKISKYAYGRDYHKVVKRKSKKLLNYLEEHFGSIQGRAFVDSAPIMEKVWAKKSGLGWIGKNVNLINKKEGSFHFLTELIVDIDIEPDGPVTDHCGSCTACLDACPTDALYEPYKIDGTKCISYLTIELKHQDIPNEFKGKLDNHAFGCDICQDVCPWNKFSKQTKEQDFSAHPDLLKMHKKDWEEITEEVFDKIFYGTPVKRAKFVGLKRNLKFIGC